MEKETKVFIVCCMAIIIGLSGKLVFDYGFKDGRELGRAEGAIIQRLYTKTMETRYGFTEDGYEHSVPSFYLEIKK